MARIAHGTSVAGAPADGNRRRGPPGCRRGIRRQSRVSAAWRPWRGRLAAPAAGLAPSPRCRRAPCGHLWLPGRDSVDHGATPFIVFDEACLESRTCPSATASRRTTRTTVARTRGPEGGAVVGRSRMRRNVVERATPRALGGTGCNSSLHGDRKRGCPTGRREPCPARAGRVAQCAVSLIRRSRGTMPQRYCG
jgi:hypothetical protein